MTSDPRPRSLIALSGGLAALIAVVYLLGPPIGRDLAAQTFRADLFDQHGFVLWNNGWYGGHSTLGYSLLFPPLAALLGVRLVGALAAVAAACAFAALVGTRLESSARSASLWFAVGVSSWLFTGRLTFLLGTAIGLAALLARDRRHLATAGVTAALCGLASPVSGLFCCLASVAIALGGDRRGGLVLALPSGAATLAPGLLFPSEGVQPFPFWTWFAIPVLLIATLRLVPREYGTLRIGVVLYAALATLLFVVPTPVGSNVVRLGMLFAGPLAVLVLARRPRALALVALPLLYWLFFAPIRDIVQDARDPAVERSYYEPLVAELDRLAASTAPARIEIVPTKNRWEAAYVAPQHPLARGWLRQLESDDFDLFTDHNLTAGAYRDWLDDQAVSYVAAADAGLDYLAEDEIELVEGGLSYLEPVWSNEHWQLYRVRDPRPIGASALGVDWFEVDAPRPGPVPVRIRFSPMWTVAGGEACVEEGEGDWTVVDAERAGTIRVQTRLFGSSCSE